MALNYWQQKHEKAYIDFSTGDTRTQNRSYTALHGVLMKMAEIIGNRYFTIPFARQREFYEDVVIHAYLRSKEFDPSKGKAYSFASMIIKQRFYNLLTDPLAPNKIQLEYIDSYEPVDSDNPMYEEKEDIDTEAIINELQTRKKKLVRIVTNEKDGSRSLGIIHANQLIQTLDLCVEYLLKFDNFDTYSVAEYCANNSTMKRGTIGNYFYELFGKDIVINGVLDRNLGKVEKPKKKRRKMTEERKLKMRVYQRKYRLSHPEQIRKLAKKYREDYPEKKSEYAHKYYLKHGKELQRKRFKDPEFVKKHQEYCKARKEKLCEYQRNWRLAHKEEVNQHQLDYYYRKKIKKLEDDNNTINNNATPINGSSNTGLLHSIPIDSCAEDQILIGTK